MGGAGTSLGSEGLSQLPLFLERSRSQGDWRILCIAARVRGHRGKSRVVLGVFE